MKVTEDNLKKIIYNSLDFIHYQVENDKCTTKELWSLTEFILNRLNAMATVDEIAQFYEQSNNNVRNVLSRRLMPKDAKERVTRYRFGWFLKMMPSSWIRK